MGCGGSKVDDLPLVIRCRERKDLIKSAAGHRYDLSASHLAYFHSLKDIGYALSRFVDEELVLSSPSASSPVLTLPSDLGKTNKSSSSSGTISHIHSINDDHEDSESDSGSSSDGHIHIHDDDDGGPETKPPSASLNPPHYHNRMDWDDPYIMNRGPPPNGGLHLNQPPWLPTQPNWGAPYAMNPAAAPPPNQPPWGPTFDTNWGPYGGAFDSYNAYGTNSNSNRYAYYMRKSAPASRTVIHREEARGFQETGQWPDPSYYQPYENGGFFGYPMGGPPPPEEPKQPTPKSPPPPPPPKASGWDFLNFFDSYDTGYPSYGYGYGSMTSSPDSSEVREREGIPDLEEETESESHNEEARRRRTLNTKRNPGEGTSRSVPKENIEASSRREASRSNEGSFRSKPPGNSEGTSKAAHDEGTTNSVPAQYSEGAQSINVEVDKSSPETAVSESIQEGYENKKEVSFDIDEGSINEIESSKLSSLTTLSAHGSRDLQEVVNEIKDEFEVAFGYGKEVAVMLEAGKVPYQPRFAVLKVVLSRILYQVAPSLSSSHHAVQSGRSRSQIMKLARSYHLDAVADVSSTNLSSTLEELYVWEKKLYKEVKEEERLRVIYEKMCKRLKNLDAHGAESSKIDATRGSIRRLQTKLNVCIKAIDVISSKIHKLRDEELQPQVTKLINGLIRMWRSIVKCHQKQFQAIIESKTRTLKANTSSFQKNSSLSATLELETGLLTWCKHFNDWINAQKSYINSLNRWLRQCIHHEPEVTIDGEVPFSPGSIGAPPIFIICNDWHKGITCVSEEQVSKAINNFASNLRQLLERQDEEQHQRLKTEYLAKDFAKKRHNLQMKHGKKIGQGQYPMQEKMAGSIVPSESGVSSPEDDQKVNLDSLRKKMDEERGRHKEAMKLVHDAASSSLQGGIIPIFKALENFTSDALKAHEQVRLQNDGS